MVYPISFLLLLVTYLVPTAVGRCIESVADPLPKAPDLVLPWGTYKPQNADKDGQVALYKNVRFGQNPVGDLRFKAPKFPDPIPNNAKVQDPSYGPICYQAGNSGQHGDVKESEDCLFADIYVPYKAFGKDEYPLPVVNYIYGGAFYFGSKDTTLRLGGNDYSLYSGKGLLNTSDHDFIWVVGNYRVGAFGWLAGTTVEATGTPNAGLHDQKLLLDFIQQHISKVNGDKESVSVWGNSAGASSIMHHMTAGDGYDGPTFHRAALWSPAYQFTYDRKGAVEGTFKNFAIKAGCGSDLTLACLRKLDGEKLNKANQDIVAESSAKGLFPFSPALDGSYVKAIPMARLGSYFESKNLQSVVVSHVGLEPDLFAANLKWVKSEDDFQRFLNLTFPGSDAGEIKEAISETYTISSTDDTAVAQYLRLRKVVEDACIICNVRAVMNRYKGRSWAMQFNFPPAFHGSDLLPASWNKDMPTRDYVDLLLKTLKLDAFVGEDARKVLTNKLAKLGSVYQRLFAGYAAYGSPNALLDDEDTIWENYKIDALGKVSKVMNVGVKSTFDPQFEQKDDEQTGGYICQFWANVASYIGDGSEAIELETQLLRTQTDRQGPVSSWEL